MYISRFNGLGQDDPVVFDDSSVSLPDASTQWPTIGTDWTDLVNTALKTWGTVESAKAQVQVAKARTPYPASYYTSPPSSAYGQPGYLPFPGTASGGTLFGLPISAVIGILIIGGIALAVSNR